MSNSASGEREPVCVTPTHYVEKSEIPRRRFRWPVQSRRPSRCPPERRRCWTASGLGAWDPSGGRTSPPPVPAQFSHRQTIPHTLVTDSHRNLCVHMWEGMGKGTSIYGWNVKIKFLWFFTLKNLIFTFQPYRSLVPFPMPPHIHYRTEIVWDFWRLSHEDG